MTEATLFEVDLTDHEVSDMLRTAVIWCRNQDAQIRLTTAPPDDPAVVDAKALLQSMGEISAGLSTHGAYTRPQIRMLQTLAHTQIVLAGSEGATNTYIHGFLILDKLRSIVGGEDLALEWMAEDIIS